MQLQIFTPHQHGTTLTASERQRITRNALTEVSAVVEFYRTNGGSWTADEIHRSVLPGSLLTNVRRILSDLSSERGGYFLKKDEAKRQGLRGVATHTYSIR